MHKRIPKEFNNYLNSISDKYYNNFPERYEGDGVTPTEYEYYLQAMVDLPTAKKSIYTKIELEQEERAKIVNYISAMYPRASISQSGNFFYPENGFMSWHTNSNTPGRRIYLAYVKESNKSIFKYIKNNREYISPDLAGWNMREFHTTKANKLWHCVYTETPRMSIGFRVIDNLL